MNTPMTCPQCHSAKFKKNGFTAKKSQRYQCKDCHKTFSDRTNSIYCNNHFSAEIISETIFLYSAFPLSSRQISQYFATRGVKLSHETVIRWINIFSIEIANSFIYRKKRNGCILHIDETYTKKKDKHLYNYRMIDENRFIIYEFLSDHRDLNAATIFLSHANENLDRDPLFIISDKHQSYKSAIEKVFGSDMVEHVTNKSENMPIERDHAIYKAWYRLKKGFFEINSAQALNQSWRSFENYFKRSYYNITEFRWWDKYDRIKNLYRIYHNYSCSL